MNLRPARSRSTDISYISYVNMDQIIERTSSPRWRMTVNLMRYPSATVISAHKCMKNKTNSDNSSSGDGNGATTSNNNQPDITYRDNTVTNPDNSVADEPITNSDNPNTKPDSEGTPHTEIIPTMSVTDDNTAILPDDINKEQDAVKMTMMTDARTEAKEPLFIGTIIVNLDIVNNETEGIVQATDHDAIKSTDAETLDDPLQGKSTLEKIAIEMLLNMGDSLQTEDPLLNENAQLMPVDKPLEIPIEPKGNILTELVNPEALPIEMTPPWIKEWTLMRQRYWMKIKRKQKQIKRLEL